MSTATLLVTWSVCYLLAFVAVWKEPTFER